MENMNSRQMHYLTPVCLFSMFFIIALLFTACPFPDPGPGGRPELPYELKNTRWMYLVIDTSGEYIIDRVQFGDKNTVTVIPASGTEETFTLTRSGNDAILWFGDEPAGSIEYRYEGSICLVYSVSLGGVEKTDGWEKDIGLDQKAIDAIKLYLAEQDGGDSISNPVHLSVNIQLSEVNWKALLGVISEANKYVALDLSECACSYEDIGDGLCSDGTFGKVYGLVTRKEDRIVSLILPDATTSIQGAHFSLFSSLTSISFPSATIIGEWAWFHDSSISSFTLTGDGPLSAIEDGKALVRNGTELIAYPTASGSITLDTITSLGEFVFYGRTGLTVVNLPKVTSIGFAAFGGCTSLTGVNIPKATDIDGSVFSECTSLTSVSFPEASSIGDRAFSYCANLASVNFPEVISIDRGAFFFCASLTSVSFPKVTTIGPAGSGGSDYGAFGGCTSLTDINLPKVTSIGFHVFEGCTSLTSVILGITAPTLGGFILPEKTVAVKVPLGATGYGPIPATYSGEDGTENWGNGFRGGGWNGTGFVQVFWGKEITLTPNSNITLYVVSY